MKNNIRNKAHLPNEEGYEFIAILKDGSEVVATVQKDNDGLHFVEGWSGIKAWKKKID